MSEKLYYRDSHIKDFSATVLDCVEAEGAWLVELDRTAFFPEGGGQYSDTGVIDGVSVSDVQEEGDTIWHKVAEPIEVGTIVECSINWPERFEKMQCHTGEHIISGIVHALYGYDNVGFHLGEDYVTLDFDGPLTREQLDKVEDIACAVIASNVPVETSFPEPAELAMMEYRSKLDLTENVRIVSIPGVDVCACCAPHVAYTGEVGMLKLLDCVKHKKGVRIFMTAGFRLLRDYRMRYTQTAQVSSMLAVPQAGIVEGVERLQKECADLSYQLKGVKIEKAMAELEKVQKDGENMVMFVDNWDYDVMVPVADKGKTMTQGIFALFSATGEGQYRYVIASETVDLRAKTREINQAINGKGGGSSNLIQGKACGEEEALRAVFH
ncbi:MAG: hypothetical protein IKV30_06975 [Clostridia bacterium]|nr:hypothetical protein [Clostridia bacterium]